MPAGRVSDTHLLIAAGVLTILLGGTAAFIEPPGGAGEDSPSSFSSAAAGGAAAFHTLRDLGYTVERSYEPMTGIRNEPARTTLVMTGTIPPSEQDRRALQTFLERGGVVLLVGTHGADFLRVGGAAPPPAFGGSAVRHRTLVASPLAANASEILMVQTGGRPKFGPSYVAVFAVSADEPLVSTARVGRGRVVWWAAPTPVGNAHVAGADNLQHLLNVLGPPASRTVLWDEHYHGHSRSLWSYAAGTPVPWIGLQLGVMALAAFATYSRRRGPVRARAVDARTSPMEFVDMLRALYKRAGAAGAAVATARSRLVRTVVLACGIPADSTDDVFGRAVATKIRTSAAGVADLLGASARAARDPQLPSADALKLTQRLQRLTEEVAGRKSEG